MSGDEEQIATTVAPAGSSNINNLCSTVKVGGMRIAKHVKEPEEKPLTRSELMKQAEEYNSEIASVPQHSMVTRVSLVFLSTVSASSPSNMTMRVLMWNSSLEFEIKTHH
ncbi:hypothetical protein D915_000823 [Fasciola hepatica]|uniref:Uncharacterized protein n=1 Tax=Fasciola hepatica TaxID=6192 RepID=A0A4E0S401_FASHE|nr:hypothetical protein D915_000823 [Fasciola hepatica]